MIFVIGFYFNTLYLTQTANKSEHKKHKTDEEILIDFFFYSGRYLSTVTLCNLQQRN